MKYVVFLALLPCILTAEIQKAICIDGRECAQGQYCCELSSGESGCCDISKELQDKGYVPALPPSSALENVSMAAPETQNANCPGTQCGSFCIPTFRWGTCCSKPGTACPSGTKCCSQSYYDQPWCCHSRCSSIRNMCLNSAVTTSTAIISLLFAFMMGIVSKYVL